MIDFIQGDCLEILSGFRPGSFSVAVTSPPYNIGTDYADGIRDDQPRAAYLAWCARWLLALREVLADDGSLFLNIGSKPTDPWGPHQLVMVAGQFFCLQNTWVWVKSLSEDGGPVEGHVKPLQSERFVNDAFEYVFHLTKTGNVPVDRLAVGVPYADESNLTRGTRGKHGNVRCRGNVLVLPYPTQRDKKHPAAFPVALADFFFRLHGLSRITKPTLDPFSGVGSSARAARALGLDHVGIELSPTYVAEAQRLLMEDEQEVAREKLRRVGYQPGNYKDRCSACSGTTHHAPTCSYFARVS